MNRRKFANRINKFKAYKTNIMRMSRYNAGAGSSSYGNVFDLSAFFYTANFDHIERYKKIKT